MFLSHSINIFLHKTDKSSFTNAFKKSIMGLFFVQAASKQPSPIYLRYSHKPRFTDNRFITSRGVERKRPRRKKILGMLTSRWRWSCFETSTSATSRSRCHSGTENSPSSGAASGEQVPRSARRRRHRRRRRPKSRRHFPRRNCNEKRKLSLEASYRFLTSEDLSAQSPFYSTSRPRER